MNGEVSKLREWEAWLSAAVVAMEQSDAEWRIGQDRELFEHRMPGDDALARERLDAAVENMIRACDATSISTRRPPPWQADLQGEEIILLQFRILVARRAVRGLMGIGEDVGIVPHLPAIADPEDEREFVRWMLVRVWDKLGATYLSHIGSQLASLPPGTTI